MLTCNRLIQQNSTKYLLKLNKITVKEISENQCKAKGKTQAEQIIMELNTVSDIP